MIPFIRTRDGRVGLILLIRCDKLVFIKVSTERLDGFKYSISRLHFKYCYIFVGSVLIFFGGMQYYNSVGWVEVKRMDHVVFTTQWIVTVEKSSLRGVSCRNWIEYHWNLRLILNRWVLYPESMCVVCDNHNEEDKRILLTLTNSVDLLLT